MIICFPFFFTRLNDTIVLEAQVILMGKEGIFLYAKHTYAKENKRNPYSVVQCSVRSWTTEMNMLSLISQLGSAFNSCFFSSLFHLLLYICHYSREHDYYQEMRAMRTGCIYASKAFIRSASCDNCSLWFWMWIDANSDQPQIDSNRAHTHTQLRQIKQQALTMIITKWSCYSAWEFI